MTKIAIEAHGIETHRGRIHATRWQVLEGDPLHPLAQPPAPIVLLHDSLGCVELWRDFPARLAEATGRDVIAYDRLGFGRSDPCTEPPAPLRFIHDEAHDGFRAVLEAFKLERFILFGHSVGGGMAVGCAAAYPARCLALITESAQAFPEDRTLQGIRQAKLTFSQPEQMQRLAKYHGEKAPWVLSAWVDSWLAPAFADWRLNADLQRVCCPVLALHGNDDEYGSVLHPQRIAEQAGAPATVCILDACGHVPHREQESQVLQQVGQWLGARVP